jgi:hypothetical protein
MHQCQRAVAERLFARQSGHAQAVAHVVGGFGALHRAQVHARDHALGQLLQLGPGQLVAQFGLADQHDLQQLAFLRFQVGQQAQQFQQLGRQRLRLVDDQHELLARGVARQQVVVQRIGPGLQAVGRRPGQRDAELLAHRLQQFHRRQFGVVDVGHLVAGRDLLQEAAADGGLAGADPAGQQHEAAAALQPVQQVGQCFAVHRAQVQEARVRRDRERLLLQAEEGRVHGAEDSGRARPVTRAPPPRVLMPLPPRTCRP